MPLQVQFTGQVLPLLHIVERRRPFAKGLIQFDTSSDIFYSALDEWNMSSYLANWIRAHEAMDLGRSKIIVVKSYNSPSIATFCEAYVGWLVNEKYVFQDTLVEVAGRVHQLMEGDWDSLVEDFSEFSSEEPTRRLPQWIATPDP